MKQTRDIMGMPVSIEVRDEGDPHQAIEKVFDYFRLVDERFSTYKHDSEISRFNRGEISHGDLSDDMREVFALAEEEKGKTRGYFDIKKPDGSIDPSGIVKGWAIKKAAEILRGSGCKYFYIDAGGDIQASAPEGSAPWKVGIRSPFKREEIVKSINITDGGVATSGTYIRGQHIYDPHNPGQEIRDVVSITVVADDIYKADIAATAAFAMGMRGIEFVSNMPGYEAYQIDANGKALMTKGFSKYVQKD
ncbi:FAD:protein FMN transferase [Patescibacteria group bacterium]|nr:FAD:protein FMN transferase [Patescibacteria group bacterium]